MDFTRSASLTAEVWKLTDHEVSVLFIDYILPSLYGRMEFEDVLEGALNKMKTAKEGK
mgnify:CR=1 FL=1